MSRQAARTLLGTGIAVTACVAFGLFLITWGNYLASQGGTYSNAPWSLMGVVFILTPLWAGIGWIVTEVVKFSVQQHRRYRAWKASLTPQQRAAVDLAEAAAITTAVAAMREHHKRTDARLTASVMGRAPLSSTGAGIMAAAARLNATRQTSQHEWTAPGTPGSQPGSDNAQSP
ncbi:MAG TPA: hypothetical protein VIY52_07840 [Streptosporangiaceae bacterium]